MGDNKHPICCVPNCGAEGVHGFEVRQRGGISKAYVCEHHKELNEAYSADNLHFIGEPKANGDTFSYELELSDCSFSGRVELAVNHFLPTNDNTVFVEMKSPIYNGLNGLSKYLKSVEDLMKSGNISNAETWQYWCGTHLHTGNRGFKRNGLDIPAINADTMDYVRRYYHSLFVPLCQVMEQYPEVVKKLFGRDFGTWARKIDGSTDSMEHRNFINVQHDTTLEWRLSFFVNAEQYQKLAHFCRDAMHDIQTMFLYTALQNEGDTPNEKQARKSAAQKTGAALAKLFERYITD